MKNILLALVLVSLLSLPFTGCDNTTVAPSAPPVVTIKLYKDNNGEWRWNRKAENNKIIGASTESFHNKQDAIGNAKLNYGANLTVVEE